MKNIKRTNVLNFPNNLTQIEREVEAIIFAAAEPLDVDTIESKISKRAFWSLQSNDFIYDL